MRPQRDADRPRPRVLLVTMLVVVAAAVAALVAPALLTPPSAFAVSVPTEPPSPPPTGPVPDVPVAPQPSEQPTADPSPTPSPSPSPTPTPTTSDPELDPDPSPRASPSASPSPSSPVPVGGTSGDTVVPGGSGPPPRGGGVDQPQVAPPADGAATLPARTLLVTTADGLPGALGGVFALGFATVLAGLAASFTTFTMTNRGALVAHAPTGEIDMQRTRRTRTLLGVALLGVAGIIGLVGYLRISVETLVPVQVVYLASAGFGVVLFGIAGGSLLVAETLRSDEHRVRELESAVATLASHLADQVTDPPRLVDRGADDAPAAADPDDTADGTGEDEGGPGAAGAEPGDDPTPPAEQTTDPPTTRIRTVRRVQRSDD